MSLRPAGALLATALLLAACSSGGDDDDASNTAGAASCAPSSGPVTLTYTSWIPGIEEVAAVWNAKNPNIQVKVQTGPNGNGGTYQNFFNQIKAGNTPDLGQIEYDALPGFRVQDGLTDLGGCDLVAKAKDQFVDWTWNQVSFGEQGHAYGVPQDAGPMALFYRADLFEQNGIAIPKTWAEYAAAAYSSQVFGTGMPFFSNRSAR